MPVVTPATLIPGVLSLIKAQFSLSGILKARQSWRAFLLTKI
jgi:hypothetical protein